MKHFSLNTLLCTIVVASIAIAPCESDDKLITQTCSKTPYPAQCISYIKADDNSKDVRDVPGLGIIMAQVLVLEAQAPKDILFVLLGAGKRPDIQVQLKTCLESYSFIIKTAMPAAIDSFKIGKPRLAEDYANTAALVVSKCEKSFNGKSPITNENNVTHEVARILGAIAKQL
ncbi:cell wall / vacuolar inhibitor of fructosidase 1-like [Arachis stenosperma]|uniref:cell wall / vacuolar inhibitor of fructosidase 1-like n=1 Tax=Arachis stenosperma TaxID=217475 RepID=UPI0025ACE4B8|nr:cell wall / vacuolar inhibitor of fructosidase 1-like [Arachis stenosperma]